MPQIIADVLASKEGEIVTIQVEYQGRVVTSEIFLNEVDTPQKAVQWLIAQRFPVRETVTAIQKRITATVHQETDPVTGAPFWVVDSIDSVDPLPEDAFDAWIDANVVDLASAKQALKLLGSYVRRLRDL